MIYLLAPNGNAQEKKQIVADVNGTKIYKEDFDNFYRQRLLYVGHKAVTKESALDYLINRELGIQQARKKGIDKDPEVIKKRNDILHHALISMELEDKISEITISEEEVKKYYESNKEYRSSHILYRLRAIPSEKEVADALELMMGVYQKVKEAPEKFPEFAKQYSQTANSSTGSDLGYLPPTSLAPEYFNAISGKNVGFITRPVRTQFGYHIIKVTGIKTYAQINQSLYRKILFDIKRDKILSDYYTGLKKSAKVKIFKDRL
jgi:parvulin-like peptidyl-prolyl isomerase